MKKIFTIAICALLLLMLSVPAFAENGTALKVTASENELHRGDVVTFTVSISGDSKYRSLAFKLDYDPEVYEYVSDSYTLDAKGAVIFQFMESNQALALSFGMEEKDYAGTIMTFQLKVISEAVFGSSEVSLKEVKVVNAQGEIPVDIQGVKLSVKCVHEYEWSFKEGENTHTATCKICGTQESGKHKWGEGTTAKKPTCSEKGQTKYTCTQCSATKFEDIEVIEHKWDDGVTDKEATCTEKGQTKYTCTECSATKFEDIEVTDHKWDDGVTDKKPTCTEKGQTTFTCTQCSATKFEDIAVIDHKWDKGTTSKKPTCTEKGQTTYTCTQCSATKFEDIKATGHAWANDCDDTCENGCGKTRDASHKFKSKLSKNEERHWYECEVCGEKKDSYKHTPGPEATETEDQTCEICGYVIQKALGHTYDDECDDTCNTCGETREAPHAYSEEWRGNADGHWHMCMACQEESELFPHEPGEEATEDSPQVCTECKYWIVFPLNHAHSFNDTWLSDDDGHWQTCLECLAAGEKQNHQWDEGTIVSAPTVTEEGSKLYVCTICNYEKTEVLPYEEIPETTPNDPSMPTTDSQTPTQQDPTQQDPTQQDPTQQDPNQQKEGFPWWIVAVAAAVLMVIGIVLLILEWRNSKKTNMHGKFSGK